MSIPQATRPERDGSGQGGEAPAAAAQPMSVPRFPSSKILGAGGEAEIEHDGHLYRLRRTSRGGLVLTK